MIKYIGIGLAAAVAVWLLSAFISTEINPFAWPVEGRIGAVIGWAFVSCVFRVLAEQEGI